MGLFSWLFGTQSDNELPRPDAQSGSLKLNAMLHSIAFSGDLALIKQLIASGADVNWKDPYQHTVLMEAAASGRIEVIEELLRSGAEINARDAADRTALDIVGLHSAKLGEDRLAQVVTVLQKAGAVSGSVRASLRPPRSNDVVLPHDKVEVVGACEIANYILARSQGFVAGLGMALVIQEGLRIRCYVFNGLARVSWDFTNGVLRIDDAGQAAQDGPPREWKLKSSEIGTVSSVLSKAFSQQEVSVKALWQLDKSAWDYLPMKALHENDTAIRISFHR